MPIRDGRKWDSIENATGSPRLLEIARNARHDRVPRVVTSMTSASVKRFAIYGNEWHPRTISDAAPGRLGCVNRLKDYYQNRSGRERFGSQLIRIDCAGNMMKHVADYFIRLEYKITYT